MHNCYHSERFFHIFFFNRSKSCLSNKCFQLEMRFMFYLRSTESLSEVRLNGFHQTSFCLEIQKFFFQFHRHDGFIG